MYTTYEDTVKLIDGLHAAAQTPILWSPPGMGKTSLIHALTNREAAGDGTPIGGVAVVNMAGKTPEDLMGIPRIADQETPSGVFPATTTTLPDWAVRALRSEPESRFYVVWDEFTRATPETQVVVQETLLSGELNNGAVLPGNVRHILAANPPEEVSGNAFELTDALSSRLAHLSFRPSLDSWVSGMRNGFPGEKRLPMAARLWRSRVADFIDTHHNSIYEGKQHDRTRGWATYRTWTRLADAMAAFPDGSTLQRGVISPIVGSAGSEFETWLDTNNVVTVPLPADLIADPTLMKGFDANVVSACLTNVGKYAITCDDDGDSLAAVGVFNYAVRFWPGVAQEALSEVLDRLSNRHGPALLEGATTPALDVARFRDVVDISRAAFAHFRNLDIDDKWPEETKTKNRLPKVVDSSGTTDDIIFRDHALWKQPPMDFSTLDQPIYRTIDGLEATHFTEDFYEIHTPDGEAFRVKTRGSCPQWLGEIRPEENGRILEVGDELLFGSWVSNPDEWFQWTEQYGEFLSTQDRLCRDGSIHHSSWETGFTLAESEPILPKKQRITTYPAEA